jgi:acyl-CoA reductase-like NAD-dependent aldehyde dehydrogenase
MATPLRLRSDASQDKQAAPSPPRLGEFGCFLVGQQVRTGDEVEIRSPYDRSAVAIVHRAGRPEIERAIANAAVAFEVTKKLPSWKRAAILEGISVAIASRRDELAQTIALEAGKPLKTARGETDRAAFTFKVAAEEAKRINGEILQLDWLPGLEGLEGYVRRVPLGPVAGITPFNFPLNLVSHKMAPALAAGDPVIIRPASQTPLSSIRLGEIAVAAGWPADAIAVVPSSTREAAALVEDERIKLLSFTGSPAVGWDLKTKAGRKRVTLELGGNAAVIVHHDADRDYAAERIVWGGFAYAGQSCISAQRIYVHSDIYDVFVDDLVRRTQQLKVGDPLRDDTDVGPVIDAVAADRIQEWIDEARRAGAQVLTGGERQGMTIQPTILADVPAHVRVNAQEVFAPLIVVHKYSDAARAIAASTASDYGLQAGIFTHDERIITAAVDGIEAGGIIVNDVPTFRVDHMPYGGVKLSGFGREGIRYAIEEMTEMKLVVMKR